MTSHRDRQFAEIAKFLANAFGDLTDKTLRISDIESPRGYQSVNMHVPRSDHNKGIFPGATLVVWGGHMGRMLPSAETMAGG